MPRWLWYMFVFLKFFDLFRLFSEGDFSLILGHYKIQHIREFDYAPAEIHKWSLQDCEAFGMHPKLVKLSVPCSSGSVRDQVPWWVHVQLVYFEFFDLLQLIREGDLRLTRGH